MKFNIRTALLCSLALVGFTSCTENTTEASIVLPLRKAKSRRNLTPRFANPTWENKIYSTLESARDRLHRLGSTAEVDINILNDNNWKYEATIYVGSDLQEFNVHMDTGSNKLIMLSQATQVASQSCSLPNRFDSSTSSTFVDTGVSDQISYLDGSYIIGDVSRDTVSFDSARTYKATNFQFLLATSQNGFECDDGLIGMTRMSATQLYPQFIQQLYSQNRISSKVFSLYLAGYGEDQSSMQLGGFTTSYLKTPAAGIQYVPLVDYSIFWTAEVKAVRIGLNDYDTNGKTQLGWTFKTPGYAILDTGTSLMLMPQKVFPTVMKALLRNTVAVKTQYGYYVTLNCDPANYDTLYLQMGDNYFAIPPEEYIYTFEGTAECIIGFEAMADDTWLIGDVFLRNYYSVWDHDNARIGLSPHKTSLANIVSVSDVPLPVNTFHYTTAFDIMWEIAKIVGYGSSAGLVVASFYFIADVIITNIQIYYFG